MARNDRFRSSNYNLFSNRKAKARRRNALGRRLALEQLEERRMLSFHQNLSWDDVLPICEIAGEAGRLIYQTGAYTMSQRSPTGGRLPKVFRDAVREELGDSFGDTVDNTTFHWGAKLLDNLGNLKPGSNGQTFGYDVYLARAKPDLVYSYSTTHLLIHELVHVRQYERYSHSLSNFGYHYFKGWCKADFSYSNNDMEEEAEDFADDETNAVFKELWPGPVVEISGITGKQNDGQDQVYTWEVTGRPQHVEVEFQGSIISTDEPSGTIDFNGDGLGRYPFKVTAWNPRDEDWDTFYNEDAAVVVDDDKYAPTITIEPSVRIMSDANPRLFSWSIVDDSGIKSASVSVTDGSGATLYNNTNAPAGGAFDFTSMGLGRFTIAVTATDYDDDRSGDEETRSRQRSVLVYDDDPDAPFIRFRTDDGTPLLGSDRSESHGITNAITWDVTDASGISQVQVTLWRDAELLEQFQANAQDRIDLDGYGLGTFRVELSATDGDADGWVGDQLTGTGSASVTVTNDAPTLFAGGPYLVEEGKLLALEAIGSDVDPGDSESLVYAWDLDSDGLFDEAAGSRPVVTWDEAVAAGMADDGTYIVHVRVTDTFGATADATATVTVLNGAPQVESILSDPFIDENTSLTVTGKFSDPSPLDTHSVLVFWGDGTSSPAIVNAVDRTFTASHHYEDDDPSATPFDEYVVQVEVTDDDGGSNPHKTRTLRVETDSVGGIELPSFPLSLPAGVSGLLESAHVLVDPQEVSSTSGAAQVFDHDHLVNYPPSGPFDLQAVATTTVSAVGEHDHSFNVLSQTKTFSGSFYPTLANDSPYVLDSTWQVVDPGTGLPVDPDSETGQLDPDYDHDHTPGDVTFTTSTTFTYMPNFYDNLIYTNFFSTPSNLRLNGDANRATSRSGNGWMRLTVARKSQMGSLILNGVNSPVKKFDATFGLYIGLGSGHADGFSFGYGPLSNSSLFGEEGPSGRQGLWVSFDTYRNSSSDTIGVTIFYNGSKIKHYPLSKGQLSTDDVSAVRIRITEGGSLTITHSDALNATVSIPGWNAQSHWRFGMGARTGAATDYHELDYLRIKAWYPLTYTVSTSSVNSYILPPFTANGTLQKAVVTLDAGSEITSITDGGQFMHNHDFSLDVGPLSFAEVTSLDGAAGEDHTHAVDFAPVELDFTSEADLRGFFLQEASVVLPQLGSGSTDTLSHAHELAQGIVPFHSTIDFTYDVASTIVRVRNIDPVITALSLPTSTVENSTVQLTGQFEDLGSGDTHVVRIDWGDGTTDELSVPFGQRQFATSHEYADDNPSGTAADTYQVAVRVLDDDGGEASAVLEITVLNELPVLTLAAAVEVAEGSLFELPSAIFSDRGLLDTHTAVVDWGDGETSIATVSQGTGGGVVSDQHVYGDEGDYNVRVTLRDDDTGEASQTVVLRVLNVAPTINNLWVEGPVIEGAGLTLRASVTDPGDDVLTYIWDFGDGTPIQSGVDLDAVNHTYVDEGTYTVTLSVDDSDGGLTSRSLTAVIPDLSTGLMIAGAAEVTEGTAYPLTLSALTALAAGAIDSWVVDWGDGTTDTYAKEAVASDGVVWHTYVDGPANYTVRVDVNKTASGVSPVGSLPVAVLNAPPEILNLDTHVVYREGDVQQHSALAVDSGGDPLTYTWDFGDGSPTESGLDLRNVEHRYADDGIFFLTVTVDDGDGGVAVRSVPVVTTNVAPTIELTGNALATEGQAFELTLGEIFDPGQDTVSGWIVDWGDGRTDSYDYVGIVTHSYADGPQSHVIRVALEDEDGIHGDAGQLTVSVLNAAPEILSISGDASADEGQRINLSANVVDPAGPYDVLNYLWDFGDGTPVVEGINRADVRHAYADNGAYVVTLTVADEDGGTSDSTFEVTVDNVAPTSIVSGPATAIEGQPYEIKFGSVMDPGDDTVTEWIVDWGDGEQDVLVDPLSASHTYADGPRHHDIALTLVDEDGNHVGAGSLAVDVLNARPVLTSLTGDTSGAEGGSFVFQASATDPAGVEDVLSYQWDFGDGSPIQSGVGLAQAAHTYADDGVYIVNVTVDDGDNGQDSQAMLLTVLNIVPAITLAGAATVSEGDSYELTLGEIADPGDDTVTQWLVNWGDGSSDQYSSSGIVTHQFGDGPATHTIRATLIDEDGQHFDAGQWYVAVENSPPIITNVTSSPDALEGDPAVFSATAEDPAGDLDTLTFTWDFGDGSPFESGVGLNQSVHTYVDDGTYQVRVTVADEDGGQAWHEFGYSVANVAPTIELDGPAGVNEASLYELRLGLITDPGQDTVTAWIVAWGDGQQVTYDSTQWSSSSGLVYHTYPDGPANPTITVSLVDEDGTHVAGQHAVFVRNADPEIVSIEGDTEGDEGSSFYYTAAATDPAGNEDTLTYTWDFGDGSDPVSGIDLTDVTHVFRDDGVFSASLTVTDEDGGEVSGWFNVQVNNVAPVAADQNVTTDEDHPTALDVLDGLTDVGTLDTHTAVPASFTTALGGVVTIATDGSATYDPAGQFESLAVGESATDSFTYTATDDDGGSDTATVTVTITGQNDAPTADNDAAGVNEDDGATDVTATLLAGDTDPDASDILSVSAIDDTGTLGIVSLVAGVVSYDPNGQFESLAVGETTIDTFDYTVDDGNGGTDTATVTVTINGANDDPTDPLDRNDGANEVAENAPNGTEVGITASSTDVDNGALVKYSLTDDAGGRFSIDEDTGAVTVANGLLLDYETDTRHTIKVKATDEHGAMSSEVEFTIDVLNEANVTGSVFADVDNDGVFDMEDAPLANVEITLVEAGVDEVFGTADDETFTMTTDNDGFYGFEDVAAGKVRIIESGAPEDLSDGIDTPNGVTDLDTVNDQFTIDLARTDVNGMNFAEQADGGGLSGGDTATIGYWHNKNGQALIARLDEQGELTAWLLDNFGNIFDEADFVEHGGSVGKFYRDEFFKKKLKGTPKVDAQFMAVAFATFATSSNLSNGGAVDFGFNVTDSGIGTTVVNVGDSGAAFGVANGTDMTIMALLLATNSLTASGADLIYDDGDDILTDSEKGLRVLANIIYTAINEEGDI